MCSMSPELAQQLTALDPAVLGAPDQGGARRCRVHPARTGRDGRVGGLPLAHRERPAPAQHRPAPDPRDAAGRHASSTSSRRGLGGRQPAGAAARSRRAVPCGRRGRRPLSLAREALVSPGLSAVAGGVVRARYVEAAALDSLGDASGGPALPGRSSTTWSTPAPASRLPPRYAGSGASRVSSNARSRVPRPS